MSWKRVKQTLSKFGTNLFSLKNRKSLRKKRSLGKRRRTMGGTKETVRKHPKIKEQKTKVHTKNPKIWRDTVAQEYRDVYENRNNKYRKRPINGKTKEQKETMTHAYHASMKYAPEPIPSGPAAYTPLTKRLRQQYIKGLNNSMVSKPLPEDVKRKISQYI